MLKVCAKFHENLTFTSGEITTTFRTNQQRLLFFIPPGPGGVKYGVKATIGYNASNFMLSNECWLAIVAWEHCVWIWEIREKKLVICVREKFRNSWKIVRTITEPFTPLKKHVKSGYVCCRTESRPRWWTVKKFGDNCCSKNIIKRNGRHAVCT